VPPLVEKSSLNYEGFIFSIREYEFPLSAKNVLVDCDEDFIIVILNHLFLSLKSPQFEA
jgi:hypothetical protein